MNQLIKYLEQLDLSEAEAKLYLTLLKSGPLSVRELAKAVEIKRTTAYLYIDQLVEKGLIIKLVKGSRKLIAANDPEKGIKYLIEQKLESAKRTKEQYPEMLKEITNVAFQANDISGAEIRYYKGKSGVKKIYEEALGTKELRSYVNIAEVLEAFPENSKLFDSAFKHNPEMVMLEIVEDSAEAKKRFSLPNKNEKYFYKLLPKNMRLTAQDILIYKNKVAIIHFKGDIHGIVLCNEDLYNNFKLLFDFVWKILS